MSSFPDETRHEKAARLLDQVRRMRQSALWWRARGRPGVAADVERVASFMQRAVERLARMPPGA